MYDRDGLGSCKINAKIANQKEIILFVIHQDATMSWLNFCVVFNSMMVTHEASLMLEVMG